MSVTKTLLQNQLTSGRLNASLHIRINGLSLNTSHETCQKMCKSLIQHQGLSTHAKKGQHKAKEKWKSNISSGNTLTFQTFCQSLSNLTVLAVII